MHRDGDHAGDGWAVLVGDAAERVGGRTQRRSQVNELLRAVLEGCGLVVAFGLVFFLCAAWEIGTAVRIAVRARRRSESRK